jgi:benzaldehyde dehydrogenase (NAD)
VRKLLDAAEWAGKIYSGRWVGGSGHTFKSVEPATGRQLAEVGAASTDDVRRAVQRASDAQPGWAATPYDVRAAVLRRAADLLVEYQTELEDWVVREAGLPRYFAAALGAAEEFHQAAALASAPLGQVLPSVQPRLSFTRRRPAGVVGVIAPFNAPLILAARALAPALAVGNAVVLKPDPRTTVCGGVAFACLLEQAGLPPDVFHVLPGGGDIGRELVIHPDVPVIAFTGSVTAGREVARLAAGLLKRVHLELGGNAALVVLEDADVEQAVRAGSFGSFHNAGQVCMASSRHLVAAPLVEQYTALLAERAGKLRVGNPADDDDLAYGPLIDEVARDKVHAIVQDSVAVGARLITGGSYDHLFYRPTVLADVPVEARAYQEEIFGPVAPIVGFKDIDEAARLATETECGLSLAILTTDIMSGLALAERVPVGMVHINDQTSADEPIAPFGGVGLSGNGYRIGGQQANLEAFTEMQWITVNQETGSYPF